MAKLEELSPGAIVEGIVADVPVAIVNVRWFGQAAVEVAYKIEDTGKIDNRLLYRTDEERLRIVEGRRQWAFDGDGALFRLVAEAKRIHLAYLFDSRLAVHVSQVEPLPHQISAVYEDMLPRQPLRFLLADDPGAGKTIMTGLFMKELALRGDLERCLIICPANLAEQWQDELAEKLKMPFEIIGRPEIENSPSRNPFREKHFVISRLDLLSRDPENFDRLKQVEWDLVVVDEAHKMSASFSGGKVKPTLRYKLGEMVCDPKRARHVLFLTATPHHGKEEDFQLFLALLDRDRFEGRFRSGVHRADVSDIMHRMLKEELVDFEGRPLFPERRAYTVTYALSDLERQLYDRVTAYVRTEMNRADQLAEEEAGGTRKRTVVGFALTILQRRLASSPDAIFHSLRRRRERLEKRVREERSSRGKDEELDLTEGIRAIDPEDYDELPDSEVEEYEDKVVDNASNARTIRELEVEIGKLKELETLAEEVRRAGTDRKWDELRNLLENRQEMFDQHGRRRKLIVFTEHRDTLRYLAARVGNLIGNPRAVVEIHGALRRDDRRAAQNAFVNDPTVEVLLATDAAGEGINLQRAHLMVNYDLPWNPNRIEQRFGRIHRFGQTEVCHLWNIVANETREGEVFQRLFEKLDEQRRALKDKVFDVLGQVFDEVSLRQLLLEAIRYGDSPEVKARLKERIDELMSSERFTKIIEDSALAVDTMDTTRLQNIREDMERAAALRLQPHFIAAFFKDALKQLGGSIQQREPERYEIRRVPQEIIRRTRQYGGAPVPERYERIVFEKERINLEGKPPAEFVAPGHPLLDATIDLLMERYRELLRRGTVLVDPRDDVPDVARALFFVEHEIRDGRKDKHGNHRVASRQLQFVEATEDGRTIPAGAAPYLAYRPVSEEEHAVMEAALRSDWIQRGLEEDARSFAIESLVPQHLDYVKRYRDVLVEKTMRAVKERLTKEIQYWDNRAERLKLEELAGKQPRMNSMQARQRADELTARLENRMKELELEKQLAPMPPVVSGGAIVLPQRLVDRLLGRPAARPSGDRDAIEELAMSAVEREERMAGRIPRRVEHLNLGYDIESRDPENGRLHFIEVKGRHADADSIHVTKNEWLVALNQREKFVLAVVLARGGEVVDRPHYVRDPAARAISGDLTFGITGIDLTLEDLLAAEERREVRA